MDVLVEQKVVEGEEEEELVEVEIRIMMMKAGGWGRGGRTDNSGSCEDFRRWMLKRVRMTKDRTCGRVEIQQ